MRSNFVVLQMGSEVFAARYEVADMTWDQCHTPVVSKGDPASCKNYRPISRVRYKLFVSILLNGEQVLQQDLAKAIQFLGWPCCLFALQNEC